MAVITRSAHPEALWPGIKAWFGKTYKEHPAEWSAIFEKDSSEKAYEKVVETTGFGLAPIKTEGSSIAYDTDGQGSVTTLTHVVYALGYIVTREELDDDLYKEVSERRAKGLAFSMRQTTEIVHANVFNRAFNSSYVGGDGVELCSAAHPTRAGNQSNLLTAADLSESSLEDAVKTINQVKNARGLRIALRAQRLIISTDDEFNAQRILKSNLRQGTANNDTNALRVMGSIPEVVSNHYLSDMDAWFIQTDAPEGLMSLWRNEVELTKDADFDTENAKAKARMRFATGYGDFRSIFGSAGA
ncbi:MAG: hypothetical protein JWR80_9486 [Bradyrhizobium sp.]|nr:hypothetical protein [Bradyrhizobium sp.]